MARQRDSQRERVYRFDSKVRALTTDEDMSLTDITLLVTKLSQAYGVQPPMVKDGRGKRQAASNRGANASG